MLKIDCFVSAGNLMSQPRLAAFAIVNLEASRDDTIADSVVELSVISAAMKK